jgi:hypothetical protein
MKVELEFLDETKTRVHEEDIISETNTPIPSVGENVWFGAERFTVSSRDFFYLDGRYGHDLKITFWLAGPFGP